MLRTWEADGGAGGPPLCGLDPLPPQFSAVFSSVHLQGVRAVSGPGSVRKVTRRHHEMRTSLSAPAPEKPRAQIAEGKDRSPSWQADRAACRPGRVAINDPGATAAPLFALGGLTALACSGQQSITDRFFFFWFHFLEERLPTARIKIERGLCHRSPVRSKCTHVVQRPRGGRQISSLKVIITLLALAPRKASRQPLPVG